MFGLNLYAVIAIAWAVSLGLTGWKSYNFGAEVEAGKHAQAEVVAREVARQVEENVARQIASIEIKKVTINKALERVVEKEIVFKECKTPAEAVKQIKELYKLQGDK